MTGKGYDEKPADIRKELRWNDLKDYQKKRKRFSNVMHNVVNNKASGYLMDLFEKSFSVYAHERMKVDFSSLNLIEY